MKKILLFIICLLTSITMVKADYIACYLTKGEKGTENLKPGDTVTIYLTTNADTLLYTYYRNVIDYDTSVFEYDGYTLSNGWKVDSINFKDIYNRNSNISTIDIELYNKNLNSMLNNFEISEEEVNSYYDKQYQENGFVDTVAQIKFKVKRGIEDQTTYISLSEYDSYYYELDYDSYYDYYNDEYEYGYSEVYDGECLPSKLIFKIENNLKEYREDASLSYLYPIMDDFVEYDKEFSPDVYEYNVNTTSNDVIFYEYCSANNFCYDGSGNNSLKKGKNTFVFNTKSEDGKQSKKYIVNINKVTNANNTKITYPKLNSLIVKDYDFVEEFNQDIKLYHIEIPYELNKLDIDYETDADDITITGNEDLKIGTNVINIRITNTIDDRKYSKEYKILAFKDNIKKEEVKKEKKTNYKYIILGSVILILIVVIISLLIHKKRKKA